MSRRKGNNEMTNGDRIRSMTDEELSVLCCTMNHDFPVYALGKCDGDNKSTI